MPSLTVLTEEKAVIRRALPPSTTKIFMATVARLYVAYPDPNRWTYANIMGALVFARDEIKNSFFLRIVDLRGGRGVIWEQELYHGFNYQADRPFFHTFATDNYTAGLSFADENEAGTLYHKVIGRDELLKAKATPGPATAAPPRSSGWFGNKSTSKKKERPKVDKARIGLPSNFQHLGHIGWDAEKGFNVEKIPSDWKNLFDAAGIDESQLKDEETAKFVYDFVQSRGGPKSLEKPQNAPPARAPPPPATAPPPPPSGAARRPPPPPPRQRNAAQAPVPNRNGPAPPAMPDRPVYDPTPIPVSQSASAPPMPSRSPSPVRAPPAAPPVSSSAPPPPPPPPPPPASLPSPAAPIPTSTVQPSAPRSAPADGVRVDLLASIRSAGVLSLKPATAREPTSPPPEEASAGGDLAAALASALAARSRAITTDSDDEEEDGEDWD